MNTLLAWLGTIVLIAMVVAGILLGTAALIDSIRKKWEPKKRDGIAAIGMALVATAYWIASSIYTGSENNFKLYAWCATVALIVLGVSALGWRYVERKYGLEKANRLREGKLS